MSRTIWKFPLEITDLQEISLPHRAEVLCIKAQGNNLCLWALVDPSHAVAPVRVRICGTGHPAPSDDSTFEYVDTVIMPNGLVWHVFLE